MSIKGNPVGTTTPRPDWNQNNPKKADFIKNKPDIPVIDITLKQAGKAADAKAVGDALANLPSGNGGIYVGSGDMPDGYNVQIDPSGNATDINAKVFEHIATITVSPAEDGSLPTSIVFSADSEGKPFELTDFYINMLVGATDGGSATFGVRGKNAGNYRYMIGGLFSIGLQSSLRKSYFQYIYDPISQTGRADVCPTVAASSIFPSTNVGDVRGTVVIPPYAYQEYTKPLNMRTVEIFMQGGTAKTWVSGSTFELYGVRA